MLMAVLQVSAPRFDSWWRIMLNVVGIALWLVVLVTVIVRRRRGHRVDGWAWTALIVNVAMAGLYVPVGPVGWLAANLIKRERRSSTSLPLANVPD